jgi:hexokinase
VFAASDEDPELSVTRSSLQDHLHLSTSLADRKVVRAVCELVAKRAARLAAMGVAAVARQIQRSGYAPRYLSAGIDGSVFKKYPLFKDWMDEALNEMHVQCALETADDGSGMGAALVAVVAANGGAIRARA